MDEHIKYRIPTSLVKENPRNYNSNTMLPKMLKSTLFFLLSVTILLLTCELTIAHEGHKKPQSQSAPAGTLTNPAAPSSAEEGETDEHENSSEPVRPAPLPFTGPIKDHLHNKVVHFPLALGIAGSIFVFLSLKKPEMLTAARILWFLAAAIAIGAYFSGKAQEEPFEHGAMHDIFEAHENCGIVSAISLWVGFLLTLTRRFRGLTVIVAIEVLLMLSVTGYYGGLLAHS